MTGNDINTLLSGLYQGGTALASGLIDRGARNRARKMYDKETDFIKNTWKNSIDKANEILNPPAVDYAESQTGGKSLAHDQTSAEKPSLDMKELYLRKEKGISNLLNEKYGKEYAESLNRLYNDYFGDKKSEWEIKEGRDGEFVAINKNTLETKRILDRKDTPKDFNLSKDATIKQYQADDGTTRYAYFHPDPANNDNGFTGWKNTGVSATQRDYEYQEGIGEFAEKLKGSNIGSRGSRGSKKSDDISDYSDYDQDSVAKLKEFAKLKEKSVSMGWDNFGKVEKKDSYGNIIGEEESADAKRYAQLENELQNRFKGDDVHKLSNDLYQGNFNRKKGEKTKSEVEFIKDKTESSKFRNDLINFQKDMEENIWAFEENGKKVPNYGIPADEWYRELKEAGFLDNITDEEYKIVSEWFKSKTGQSLD